MAKEQGELSLGWQIVLLLVCVYVGMGLTSAYGARLADVLGIDFFSGRTMIDVFFAAVVAIVGVIGYRGVRLLCRTSTRDA